MHKVGIEPTSPGLQPGAKTTSATYAKDYLLWDSDNDRRMPARGFSPTGIDRPHGRPSIPVNSL